MVKGVPKSGGLESSRGDQNKEGVTGSEVACGLCDWFFFSLNSIAQTVSESGWMALTRQFDASSHQQMQKSAVSPLLFQNIASTCSTTGGPNYFSHCRGMNSATNKCGGGKERKGTVRLRRFGLLPSFSRAAAESSLSVPGRFPPEEKSEG